MIVIVLFTIASCTKKSVPTADKKPVAEVAVDGAAVFSQNCARCHGATGVEGRAPNLSHLDYSHDEIVDKVKNGDGRMPAFVNKLSAKEINAVADFALHLKK